MNFRVVRIGIAVALATFVMGSAQAAGAPVAEVVASSGSVQVLQEGRWVLAFEGIQLNRKDQIKTGSGGLARIKFRDADPESGATATVVDMVPETHISLEQFAVTRNLPRKRTGFVELFKGAVRGITKGWSNGSIFSVKAGTTVCGIRGSAAAISFDPDSGTAQFTSLSGKMFTFPASNLAGAIRQAFQYSASLALGNQLPASVVEAPRNGNLTPGQRVTVGKEGTKIIFLPASLQAKLLDALEKQDASIGELKEANRQQEIADGIKDQKSADRREAQKKADDAEKAAGTLDKEAKKLLESIVKQVLGDTSLTLPASGQ